MSKSESRKAPFGLPATLLGGLALFSAIVHFWAGPFGEPPPIEETLSNIASGIRDAVVSELSGEESDRRPAASREWDIDRVIRVATSVVGLIAVFLAVASFVRREDARYAGTAAAMGVGAIAFQFFVLALGIFALVALIVGVIATLGGSP